MAPIEAEETPSGLRYRDLVVGEGATPKRGDRVELQLMAFSVFNQPLDEMHVKVAELGSDDLLAGVNEAVASMKVGGQRVLFVPRHLADQRPERSGMAQCAVVGLTSIKE